MSRVADRRRRGTAPRTKAPRSVPRVRGSRVTSPCAPRQCASGSRPRAIRSPFAVDPGSEEQRHDDVTRFALLPRHERTFLSRREIGPEERERCLAMRERHHSVLPSFTPSRWGHVAPLLRSPDLAVTRQESQ